MYAPSHTMNHNRPSRETGAVTADVARKLGIKPAHVHSIDFKDIMISRDVANEIAKVSTYLLRQQIPGKFDIADALNGLLGSIEEKAYWVEDTQVLVIRLEVLGEYHLVQVPPDGWKTKYIRWN